MEEIKKSCIEMDADKLIKMCDKMTIYIGSEREKRTSEWKERSIREFRKKINKSWFSKRLRKLDDERLFEWMLANLPMDCIGNYKMYELMQYDWLHRYGDGNLDACKEMVFLAKQSKKLSGKVFVTAEDLEKIYREDVNGDV